MARQLQGKVISAKMEKTAVVAVSHSRKHPKYLKYYTTTKKFKAHNENNEYQAGDEVIIEETRPLSKEKRFKIVSLVKKALVVEE